MKVRTANLCRYILRINHPEWSPASARKEARIRSRCRAGWLIILLCPVSFLAGWLDAQTGGKKELVPVPWLIWQGPLPAGEPGTVIKRMVAPVTDGETGNRAGGKLLQSPGEHALSCAPVLTPRKPVYLRRLWQPEPAQDDLNLVLADGRIYANFLSPQAVDESPALQIRPVDGNCDIPVLIRTAIKLDTPPDNNDLLEFLIDLPAIFHPVAEIRSASAGTVPVAAEVLPGSALARIRLSVPLPQPVLAAAYAKGVRKLPVLVDAVLKLGRYGILPASQFTNFPKTGRDLSLAGLARLIPGRDFLGNEEKQQVMDLVQPIISKTNSDWEKVLMANRLVSGRIHYRRNSLRRTPIQILTEGLGDCDDYCRLLVTILRAMEIPCCMEVGRLYDFNTMGAHAWVQVALPAGSGKTRWFICDPGLASISEDRDSFVQTTDRYYLYQIQFRLHYPALPLAEPTEIWLNWQDHSAKSNRQSLEALATGFGPALRASLQAQAGRLKGSGLMATREFKYDAGSPYLLLAQAAGVVTTKIRLTPEEDVLVETEAGSAAGGPLLPLDDSAAERMQQIYQKIRRHFFQNAESRHCLELTYERDSSTDELKVIRLRISRYLVELGFGKVLEILAEADMIPVSGRERLNRLYQVCGTRNLYFLHELSR